MSDADGAARLSVRVTPRGGRDRIDGVSDGALLVRVAASPVDGAANTAVVKLLAAALRVAPSSVRIVSGSSGRMKVVLIEGIGQAALVARWPDLSV